MSREGAVLIAMSVAIMILAAMAFGWRRRTRRDSALTAPLGVPEHAEVIGRHEILYVATTQHERPLERIAMVPLAYRARGELTLTDQGVALSLDGSPTVFIATTKLLTVDLATVAIDRVVESKGLVRLVWRVADGTVVDSFLRPVSDGPQKILTELARLSAGLKNGEQS